jgi:hypothetical protein
MRTLLAFLFITTSFVSYSQVDTIFLKNPSFEDAPRKGKRNSLQSAEGIKFVNSPSGIKGWFDCGEIDFPNESAPDIHQGGYWGVEKEALDGNTYLGLVVRDNDSWESVNQVLETESGVKTPLKAGQCYSTTMAVAVSENYKSGSRLNVGKNNNRITVNYSTPAVVRIWGCDDQCSKKELLATTEPVSNSEWKTVTLNFEPEADYHSITVEAFYNIPVLVPYNGHVLIDNMSHIIHGKCEN